MLLRLGERVPLANDLTGFNINAVAGVRASVFLGIKFISEGYLDIDTGNFLNDSFLWTPAGGDMGLL